MSKYAPLESHLSRKHFESVPMSFAEIEAVIGASLPPSARKHRAWWSNNPSNSVITYAWLGAGYRTQDVDLEGETLVFRRVEKSAPADDSATGHPVHGCMAGTVTFIDGVDLTEPADPDWGESVEKTDAPCE